MSKSDMCILVQSRSACATSQIDPRCNNLAYHDVQHGPLYRSGLAVLQFKI